jgi:hypothetical protein
MQTKNQGEQLDKVMVMTTTYVNSLSSVQFILNMIVATSMNYFIGMIKALQILSFQTTVNMDYPVNVEVVQYTITNILNVDVLAPTTNLLFNFDLDLQYSEFIES